MSATKRIGQGTLGIEFLESEPKETKVDNAFESVNGKALKTLYLPEQAQNLGSGAQQSSAGLGAGNVGAGAGNVSAAGAGTGNVGTGGAGAATVEGKDYGLRPSGASASSGGQGGSLQNSNGGNSSANNNNSSNSANPSKAKKDDSFDPFEPLAARMRPRNLDEYIGQSHLLGPNKPLRNALERHHCHSMILWGPPGVGKTTLALMIAKATGAVLEQISAVVAGMPDIREAIARAKERRRHAVRTILFVDEVHRFNKMQQDAFLPYVEDGTIIFVGATTENPSFQVNSALLSRARVFVLKKLTEEELGQLLDMTLTSERGLKKENLFMEDRVRQALISLADGDARHLLTTLEMLSDDAADLKDGRRQITYAMVGAIAGRRVISYDKNGDTYYDLISAFHKSVRGSAPDAALYWYARILEAGGDPSYVARRILAIATEDVGLADPNAMQIALNAWDIFNRVGSAEGERAIAEAAVYMALAPKSNHLYAAFNQVRKDVVSLPSYEVPMYLRNAPTKLMESLGYHKGYRYAHDFPGAYAPGECFMPEELHGHRYYYPSERGFEKYLKEKQKYLNQRDSLASPEELRFNSDHEQSNAELLKARYPDVFANDLDNDRDKEPDGLGPQISPQSMMSAQPYQSDLQVNSEPRSLGGEQQQGQFNPNVPNQGSSFGSANPQQMPPQPQGLSQRPVISQQQGMPQPPAWQGQQNAPNGYQDFRGNNNPNSFAGAGADMGQRDMGQPVGYNQNQPWPQDNLNRNYSPMPMGNGNQSLPPIQDPRYQRGAFDVPNQPYMGVDQGNIPNPDFAPFNPNFAGNGNFGNRDPSIDGYQNQPWNQGFHGGQGQNTVNHQGPNNQINQGFSNVNNGNRQGDQHHGN